MSRLGVFIFALALWGVVIAPLVGQEKRDAPREGDAVSVTPPEFRWSSSRAEAAEAAGKSSKVLLAVYFAGGLGDVEAALDLRKPATRDVLARTCEAYYVRSVGSTIERPKKVAPPTSQSQVAAFFCTPDGRVLYFWVGAPSGPFLLETTLWVAAHQRQLASLAVADQPLASRQAHLRQIAASTLKLFNKAVGPSWRDGRRLFPPSNVDRVEVCERARTLRTQVLTRNYGRGYAPPRWSRVLLSLMERPSIAPDFAHLALSELPLEPVDKLGPVVFEVSTGRKFKPFSPRLKTIAAKIEASRRDRKPVLLVVTVKDAGAFASTAIPKHPLVGSLLPRFQVVRIDRNDLGAVLDACGLEPLTGDAAKETRFLLLSRAGEREAIFPSNPDSVVLANAMRRALRQTSDRR